MEGDSIKQRSRTLTSFTVNYIGKPHYVNVNNYVIVPCTSLTVWENQWLVCQLMYRAQRITIAKQGETLPELWVPSSRDGGNFQYLIQSQLKLLVFKLYCISTLYVLLNKQIDNLTNVHTHNVHTKQYCRIEKLLLFSSRFKRKSLESWSRFSQKNKNPLSVNLRQSVCQRAILFASPGVKNIATLCKKIPY